MRATKTIPQIILRYPKLAALAAGAASAMGFAPLDLWPVTIAAFALLGWLVWHAPNGRAAFSRGWAFGVAHFCVGLNWIATAFTFQAKMPAWLGWLAVVLLALYLAVYPALASWGAWMFARPDRRKGASPDAAYVLAFAACWIVTEWMRSWVFSGFAWNPLGVALVPPGLATPSIWIGTYGVSGLVILFAGAVLLLLHQRWRSGSISFALTLAVIGAGSYAVADSAFRNAMARKSAEAQPPIPIVVVQPNIGQDQKWEGELADINFGKLAALTQTDPNRAEIILWPEAAVPDFLESGYPASYYYPDDPEQSRKRLAALLGPGDILLLGALKLEIGAAGQPIGARNSVMTLDANAMLGDSYDKSHLVPYGEYLPMREWLEPIGLSRLAPGNLDFWPGPGARNIRVGTLATAGVQVCYEIIFSGEVVDPDSRPDFLFNPSNDAWFGSWGPPQHLAQARLRAIEEGLPVIRSTPTGISAVVAADGRVLDRVPMHEAGAMRTTLPYAFAPTLFARLGNTLPLLFALLLMVSAVAIGRRGR